MYDLHVHILPGIDDGPETIDESFQMGKIAYESGTHVLVATPHRKDVKEFHSLNKILFLTKKLNNLFLKNNIEIKLLLGMENHMSLDLVDDYINGFAITINRTRYMLLEMPFFGSPNYIFPVVYKLIDLGLKPILAHPERIEMFQKDIKTLDELIKIGLLTQITAGSLLGVFGDIAKELSIYMLNKDLVNIISSDTHSDSGERSPRMNDGINFASQIIGLEKVNKMVVDTPLKVIQDKPIS